METINAVVKLSGNNLGYDKGVEFEGTNIDPEKVKQYGENICELYNRKIKPLVIIGGSNIANGNNIIKSGKSNDKRAADLLGMEATHINVRAVYEVLKEMGIPTIMLSALGKSENEFSPLTFPRLMELSNKESICLIAGGTGYAGFTTDTAAAIFAHNIGMTKIIKSTAAGAVYNRDPQDKNSNIELQKFLYISYQDVINKNLQFMDLTAIAFCQQNDIDIHVTGSEDADTLESILRYDDITLGSIVTSPKKVLELTNQIKY